jgi:hypothetical protein
MARPWRAHPSNFAEWEPIFFSHVCALVTFIPDAIRSVEIAVWANLLSKPQHQHRMVHFGKELLNRDSLSSLENENRSHPQRLGLPNRPKL